MSTDTILSTTPHDLSPEQLQDYFRSFHTALQPQRQAILKSLLNSPEALVDHYIKFCQNHYCEVGVANLHFLLSHPRFAHRTKVLDALAVLRSPRSIDFLYQYSTNCNLLLKKKILQVLGSFPQTKAHPILLEYLIQDEVELKQLALKIILKIESMDDSEALENQLRSPFPEIQKLALTALYRFEGSSWLQEKINHLDELAPHFQGLVVDMAHESGLPLNVENILSKAHDFHPEVTVKIIRLMANELNTISQEKILGFLDSPDKQIRLATIQTLGDQSLGNESIACLVERIGEEANHDLVEMILGVLLRLEDEKLVEILSVLASRYLEKLSSRLLVEFKKRIKFPQVKNLIEGFLESSCHNQNSFALHLIDDPEIYAERIKQLVKSPRSSVQSRAKELLKALDSKDLDKVFKNAVKQYERQEYPQARWTLEPYLNERSTCADGLLLYAKAQIGDEQIEGAKVTLKTLLTTSSDHVAGLKLLGSIYLKSSEPREATPLLKRAAHLSKNDPLLMEYLFSCYLQLDEVSHALQTFLEIPTQLTNPELCEQFFTAALNAGKFQLITSQFPAYEKLCMELQPPQETSVTAKTALGVALYNLGKPKNAEIIFNEIIKTHQDEVQDFECLKIIHETTKNKNHMEAYLRVAMTAFPDDKSHVENLLKFYLDYCPERCLEEINQLDPHGEFLKIKAKSLRKMGHFDESSEIFESLFLQNASDETIPFELGLNYFHKNQFKKALKYFQYYSKHQSHPERLHYFLSQCYMRLGYRDLASKHLVFALEQRPVDMEAWLLFVESLSFEKVPDELVEYVTEAREIFENHPVGLKKLGSFFLAKDDPAASRVFERLAELNPEDREVQLILANHYYKINKYSKAFIHFQNVGDDLPREQLEKFSQCAQQSLNYADAFALYLTLYKEEKNKDILASKIHELIGRKDCFYHIYEHQKPNTIQQHLKTLDDFPMFYYKVAGKCFREGKLNAAKALFERLKKVHEAYFRSDFFLGMIAILQDKKDQSRIHLENALLHDDPKPIQIYSLLGEVSFDLADLERAKHCFIKIFQSGKKTAEAMEYLYQIYSKEGQLQKFLHLTMSGTQRMAKTEKIRFLAGKAHMELGQFEEGYSLFNSLQDSSPYKKQAEFMGTLCLMQQGKFKDALQKFKVLEPHQEILEDFSYFYGTCLKELQRFPSAIERLSLALDLEQRPYESYLQLIDTHLKCLRPDEALPFFLKACKIKFPFSYCYQVCKALYSQGRHALMEELYDRCHHEVFESPADPQKTSIVQGFLLAFYNLQKPERLDHCTELTAKSDPGLLKELLAQKTLSSGFRFEILKRVSQLLPKEPIFSFHLGRFYFSTQHVGTAKQYYETTLKLLETAEGSEELTFNTLKDLSAITYELKEVDSCLNYLKLAESLKPDHIEVLEKLSYVYGISNQIDSQAKVDQKLFFLKTDNTLISKRLYKWFEKKSDLQNAIYHLKNYLKENYADVEKVQKLAQLSREAGMHTQEVQAYQILEGLGIELPQQHFLHVGQAYLALKREEKAAEAFQKYLAKHPDNQGLQFQLGMIYKNQGYLKKAIFTFREILRSESANTTVRYQLCEALFDDRNVEEARVCLEELLTIKPYHTQAKELLAKIHYRRGENKTAMEMLDQLLKSDPENIEAKLMQARLFRSEGMLEEACQNYEDLFRLTRSDEYLLELGVLNLKLNRKQTAMKHLRQLAQCSESKSRFTRMAKSLLKKERVG